MRFRIRATALTLACSISLCLSGEDLKPSCNAETLGKLWPDAANHDPKLRKKMARCGELELCTRGTWRYHWEALTVRIDQLRGGGAFAKPAGCEILPEPSSDESSQPNSPTR